MCATCGCGEGAKATIKNLETGAIVSVEPGHEHSHEHVHADGTRHSHPHAHAHDHAHGHDHPHGDHSHDHEHVHADGTRHSHPHAHAHDHAHGHDHPHGDHSHDHEHVHADGTRHSHPHAHDHAHGHDHPHGDHGHDHEHVHADGTSHPHAHDHNHAHKREARSERRSESGPTEVSLEARILAKNDALAQRNRAWLSGREILAINLMSSPGAGKTTLLERVVRDLKGEFPVCVVEGDQATANDSERIRAAGAPAVQINTGTGCHLEADMIWRALGELRPASGAVLMIENVGNLVCPALFDLGEHAKVVVFSASEGDDKPLKYPHMFNAADVVLLNKTDLLPHLDFDVAKAIECARAVNPKVVVFQVSARTGEGLAVWYDWIRSRLGEARDRAFA